MFQEFHLSVTPLDRDRYLVRTEKVSPGVPLAEEQVDWSVEAWLKEAQQLMSDPLLQVFQGESQPSELGGENLPPSPIALGQKLYDALFQGSLRDSWIAAQGIANHQRSRLRLRLGLKGNLLPRLPWEVLHTGGRESSCYRPLATGTDIAFSRYQPNLPASLLQVKQRPVKILMVLAGPDDREGLDLQQEAEDLKAELNRNAEDSALTVELNILPHPGREELTQALEQGQYQIFHYAGHSNFSDSGGDIYLVNRYTGLTETVSGEDLAGLLANNGVQLAVFNSCRGADAARARASAVEGDRNLAQALIKCGIPAVLAMAERIPDDVAKTLTRLFYRNLERGYPIDLSLSRARQGLIASYGSNQLYWALPVLYLHPQFDGMFVEGEGTENSVEDLLDPETDDIPLEVLSGNGLFVAGSDFEADDDTDFLAPLALTPDNEAYAVGEDASALAEEEDFVRSLMSDLAPTPSENPSQPTAAPPVVPALSIADPIQPPQKSGRLMAILGAMGVGAIALVLGWWFLGRNSTPSVTEKPPTPVKTLTTSPKDGNLDFAKVQTDTLTGIATEQFARGNFEQGKLAIEELLDPKRNALDNAKAVLAAVPREQQDRAEILFLSGRLAWQFALRGNKDYSIDDARRYWESAASKDPKSIAYHNALGFAYYQEGKLANANEAWSDAFELASKETASKDRQVLTTYAGLALALGQMARQQTGNSQKVLLNKALKLRQVAISEAPTEFQTEALSNNWLWSEKAIKDWERLIATSEKK
ncbi:CHAT domain-containing protein [Oscillatoria sp. FACHB-1406]|uniref:CHAT domain-containing tetratricopeptide repeat protein n=1 Tax=Oscillatoria sp. FACHB-1406 TaxID=2692846 RepID=UPI0016822ABD|nr:CHAT domain-containing protein [Oscillatoria sp. FACHB-1406]MBD2580491.1 CHAT domain-containing protein [Oscillatoria sp. FACHB-1406]